MGLYTQALNLRERLVAHASRHADDETDALECVAMADFLLHAILDDPQRNNARDAVLQEANEMAVVIGQFQTRMIGMAEYHDRLAAHARRLRPLLNEVGYPAPGSVPPK